MNWLRLAFQRSTFNRANTNLNKSLCAARRSFTAHHAYFSLLQPCRKHQKYIAQIMLASYLSMPGVLLAQGVSAAANSVHAPGFDTAANGTPIVNINAPSSKGVSRNEYNELNVDTKGLIFNNATDIVNTQLAGFVDGNSRLNGNSANIILNEVKGNSRSALNGYMEIAGRSAELIIANQNGITCNGCGFINTTRGTLTTGLPTFDGAGGLTEFDVSRGDVDISGLGLNASNVDEVDIFARSVSLNSDFWAKNATIVTGQNHINYQDKKVTAVLGTLGSGISLDVAAIGGMYANRIRLIGTEKGLGVNVAGEIKAAEDMNLDSQGNLSNSGTISAKTLAVSSKDISNIGTLLGDQVTLNATNLNNATSKGNIQAVNSLDIVLQGKFANHNSAKIQAPNGNVNIKSNSVNNQSVVAAKQLTISAEQLDNNTANGKVYGSDIVNLTLTGKLSNTNSAKIQAPNGNVNIKSNSVNNQSVIAAKQLTISAEQLDNNTANGKVYGSDIVNLTLTGKLNNTNSALIQSDNELIVDTNGDLINSNATLAAIGSSTINSRSLNNFGSILSQNGYLTITTDLLDNQSRIQGKRVAVIVKNLNNRSKSGILYGLDKIDLTLTEQLSNTDNAFIRSDKQVIINANGDLINSNANIISIGSIALNNQNLSNTGSILSQNNALTINADYLDNQGRIQGEGVLVTANVLKNSTENGKIYSTEKLDITIAGDIKNEDSAIIHADKALILKSKNGDINNTNSIIESVTSATLTSLNLISSGSILAQDETLIIRTQQFDNNALLGGKNIDVEVDVLNNNGQIYASDNAALTTTSFINNSNGGLIHADNKLTLTASGDITNQINSTIESAGSIELSAHDLKNYAGSKVLALNGGLTIKANILNNQGSLLGNGLAVSAKLIANNTETSKIESTGDLTLISKDSFSNLNGAKVKANSTLTINTDGDLKNTDSTLESVNNIILNSRSLTNAATGTISAQNGTLTINNTGNLNNQGSIAGNKVVMDSANVSNIGGNAFVLARDTLDLVSKGNIINQDGGVLYSLGNGSLEAAGTLTNSSAVIETGRNLSIQANRVINKKRQFSTSQTSTTTLYNDIPIAVPSGKDSATRTYTHTVTTPFIVSDSPQSYILSGSDMSINGVIDNIYSTISAVGNLDYVGQLNRYDYQTEIKTVDSGTDTIKYHTAERYWDWGYHTRVTNYTTSLAYNYTSASPLVLASETFTSGGNITGRAGSTSGVGSVSNVSSGNVNTNAQNTLNSGVATADSIGTTKLEVLNARRDQFFNSLSVDSITSSALFSVSNAPEQGFLIETNPLFTNYKTFISSDYLLNKMLGDETGRTGKTTSRLGDGYLEQKLVRDQILSYTGYQTLPNEVDIEATYATLMNNAVDEYKELGLSMGVELSEEQVSQLKKPIVWMVAETVQTASGPQLALVPKVYFSNTSDMALRPDGSLMAATNIDIETDRGFNNSGTMLAKVNISLKGEGIENTGAIKAGGYINLLAVNDITNHGSIEATGALNLKAGGNIISETKATVLKHQRGDHSAIETLVGNAATLKGSSVSLLAGNDIALKGSDLTASDQVFVEAGNNFTLANLAITNSSQDGNYNNRATTENQVSTLSGNNIQLKAGNTLSSEGAQINASGNLGLAANNIDLFAVKDTKDNYSFAGGNGNSTEIRTHNENLTGTTLNAGGTLSLVGQEDIFSKGSTLNGGTGIALAAGGDVVLATETAHNSSFKEVKSQSSGFFSSSSSTTTTTSDSLTNQGTNLTSGGDIQIASGADIILSGSKATAAGGIDLQAKGDIQLLSAVDQTSSRYQEQKKGTFKVKAKDQGSIKQTAVTSDLIANGTSGEGNIALTSGSNITLEGATLAANDTLSMGTRADTQESVSKDANGNYVNALGEQVGNVTVGTQALQSSEWNESSSGFRGILKDLARGVSVVASSMGGEGEIKVGESHATRTDTLKQQTSTLAANDLNIDAQNDVALIGANVAVTDTASINAQSVTIDAAHEQTIVTESHTDHTISSEGATLEEDQISLVSLTETKQTEKTTTTANSWAGSNISAGNLSINANQNVAIIASDINVQHDADIKGENILVSGREAITDTTHDSITETKTLTVGVKNAYVDVVLAAQALKDAKDAVSDAKNAYDDAKQKVAEGKLPESDLNFYKVNLAAATANVASATTAVTSAGATAAASTATYGFTINGGVSTQTDTTSTTSTQGIWNGTNINVGNSANLTSNNNLNIEGSNINTAGQLALDASNINITAGKNTYTESTESRSEGESASYGSSGGFGGGINGSKSQSDSQSVTHTNSQIGAGSLVSNSDNLTIEGGNLNAEDIDITTDKLVVSSLQDTSTSSSKSSGGSVGIGSSNNVGINASKSNADSAWVNQQSGITGGTVNIAAKDTTLTGAVIAAVDEQGQTTDKLTLTTDTLTVADLQDTDNSKSMGMDLSVSAGSTSVGGSSNGHEKEQTTKATVGLGNVTVGGTNIDEQAQFADLNRDAANSQETTKDMERGGVDISLTVDNRMLTEAGRNEIKKDFVDTQIHAGEIAQAVDDVVNTDLGITEAYGQVQKYATDRELLVQKAMDEEAQKALRGENGAEGSQNAIQALSDELSDKDGLAEKTDIALYDGSQVTDGREVNSTNDFNKELAMAGYHAKGGNTVYLNIDKTNMTDSSSVIKSTLHEQERHSLAQTGSTLNATDQTTLSTNRGGQGQKAWNAYSGLAGISTQSTTTQSAWNMVNAGRTNVAAGTAQIQTVNSEEVKPSGWLTFGSTTARASAMVAGAGVSAGYNSSNGFQPYTPAYGSNGFQPYTPGYNSTGGSQAYNSGSTRYSSPRVGRGSSNTETSILDIFGLGAVFNDSDNFTTRGNNELRRKQGSLGEFKGSDALKRENKVLGDAAKSAGLNKDQQSDLHSEVSGQGFSYHEILKIALEIKDGQ